MALPQGMTKLLSVPIEDLVKGPFEDLEPLPDSFRPDSYFAAFRGAILEEARASIAGGLESPGPRVAVTLSRCLSSLGVTHLCAAELLKLTLLIGCTSESPKDHTTRCELVRPCCCNKATARSKTR